MVPAHMGTDGHMGGGRSFMACLNLVMINLLSGPHANKKGYYVGQDGNLQGLRNGQRGGLLYQCAPLSHPYQGFWTNTFIFLGVAWTQLQWQPIDIS